MKRSSNPQDHWLRVIGNTSSRRRISFARVCVEVDASKTLVKEFYLQGENGDWLTVMVEYDWVPPMCSACKVFGHSLAACPKSKKQVTPNPPEGGSKATSEGDWIKVQKKGKGKDVIDNRVSDLPLSSQEPSRVLNISVAVRSENCSPERISDPPCRLEDPVGNAPQSSSLQQSGGAMIGELSASPSVPRGEGPSNSEVGSQYTDTPVIHRDLSLVTGEHSEGKPGLGFSTPTGISLGGSSEPLTASPDHNPLGGKVVDSLEKKSLALKGNKGKNKVSSPSNKGRRK